MLSPVAIDHSDSTDRLRHCSYSDRLSGESALAGTESDAPQRKASMPKRRMRLHIDQANSSGASWSIHTSVAGGSRCGQGALMYSMCPRRQRTPYGCASLRGAIPPKRTPVTPAAGAPRGIGAWLRRPLRHCYEMSVARSVRDGLDSSTFTSIFLSHGASLVNGSYAHQQLVSCERQCPSL